MPRQIEVFRYAADTQEWRVSDAIIDGIPGYSDDPALQRSIQLTAS